MNIDLRLGDCLEVLKTLEDNSVDSVVCDPPYGLSFMNKKWDYDVPSTDVWKECLRVLKPGGHLLAFGGSRTYHRLAVAVEDAGFEIRDQIMWVYGSGFPKSHNIGKAIDKTDNPEKWTNNNYGGGNYKCTVCDKWIISGNPCKCPREVEQVNNEWEGWGTALKPAHEPICMARKPLSEKSVAENVLKWGTGGINIDGCRIESEPELAKNWDRKQSTNQGEGWGYKNTDLTNYTPEGRFPANIMFDEEAGKLLDQQGGDRKVGKGSRSGGFQKNYISGVVVNRVVNEGYNDSGGASRFFYCPKVSKKERNAGLDGKIEIFTPTIKLVYLLKNNIWEKEDLKTKPVDMDKSLQKVIDESIIMGDNKWNIESFGNYIMEQFQKEHKYITEMEINSTTIYQTLNLWIQNHTRIYIAELFGEMVKDIKFVENVEQKSTTVNFTIQNKDGYSPNVSNVELKGLWSINITPSKSSHPTVKPIKLMEYLITLITPKGGVVLDCFMGSGSTGIAARNKGFKFIGIEKEQEYMDIAKQRIISTYQTKLDI